MLSPNGLNKFKLNFNEQLPDVDLSTITLQNIFNKDKVREYEISVSKLIFTFTGDSSVSAEDVVR